MFAPISPVSPVLCGCPHFFTSRGSIYRIVSPKPYCLNSTPTLSLATPNPRRVTLTKFHDGSTWREHDELRM